MRKIKATIQELAYRSKHYYDIKDIDDNQIKCASCGKQLYLKSGCIYSHPFVGLLQCKSCWENFRIDISNDEEKCCYICGNNIRKLYECGDKNCESTFCKTCIKRNTHQSLLHAKDDDWKCFVCEPKPLWELRAVCAVVMENLPKKRNWRNIEKIEKRILPSEKEKRAQIKRMQKNLHMICDDENSNSDFVPSIATACKKEANNKKDRLRKQRDSSSTASENDKDIRRKVKNQKSNNPMIDKTLKILLSRINLNKKQPKEIDVYRDSDEDMSLSNKVSKFKRKVISNKAMKSVNNREQFVTDSSDSKTDVDSSSESSMENEVFEKSKNFSKHVPQDKSANYRKTKELKKKVVRKRIETSESEDENLEYEKPSRNKYPVKHIKLDSSDEEQEHSKSVKRTSKHRIVDSDSSSKEFQKEKLFRKKYSSSRELKELNVDLDAKASNSKNFVSRKNKNKHKRDDDEQSDLNADLGLKKILNKCKKVCSNFQSYINEMIEQLDEEENKEKLVLTFASNTDKFMKRLCKKQEALSMSVQQLSSKKSKSYKDALKISHVSVSDDEQSSDETNASEKHQSRRKIFKSTQKRESEEVSECDSDAIFSTNETSSQKFRDKMDTKKISNLNNNDTKTDADENEMSLNETKDSDENNIASRAEIVSSPIIGTSREKYTERSSKQQSTSKNANDNTKEDNKAPDKDNKSKNSQSESSNTDMDFETIPFSVKQLRDHRYHRMEDNRTEINDSANPKKDVINESTADMFDISFDELEKTAEDEEVQKTNVVKSSNETKKQFEIESSSGDNTHKLQLQNKTNCKANVEDNNKTLIKRGKTLPLSRPDKGIDLSLNLDKPNKLAVSTRNGEKNIDDSKEVDVVEKAQEDNDDSSSVKIAETLAKKNLLEESDLSDAKDNVESTKPTKKSDTDDKEDDLTVDYSDVSTLILSNDEQICNEDIAENASEKVEVITEVKKKCNDESSANCNDKSLSRSFSEDENVKTKRATKSTDMNNDNSKTSHSLNLKNDTNDNSDTATIANSKAKKALLASSDNSGSDNSSDLSVKESQKKRKRKLRSDTDNSIPEKRRKLTRSQHRTNYKIELKKCDVFLTRLDKTVLKHYMHALKMSREYLEHKALNSLINLDNLEKSYKKRTGKVSNTSTDSDSASTKVSKDFHKKNDKQTVEMEESLMDHLKNIENDDLPVAQTDSNFDESINEVIKVDMPVSNAALLSEANRFAKQNLLNGSESEADFEADSLLLDSDDKESMKTENKKIKSSEKVEETSPKQDENDKEKSMKSKWRQDKILTQKFSDTDSEAERNKWKEKQTNLEMKQDKNCNSDSEDEEKQVKLKKRKKIRRRILDSDSDIKLTDVDSNDFTDASNTKQDSDDSMDLKKEKLKRKGHKRRDSKSSTDSLFEEKKPKPKRKRLRKMTSDSDSSDTLQTSQGTPGKSGRKNIRKVLKDKQVAEDTKQAAKEEEERKKRITERQAMYNEMYEMRLAGEEKVEKLVLDFDIKTKQELVKVHDELTKRLKPHQAEGIKFMWDACFESLERIKITPGSGCIIAHCMGLGKTLQVIALTHTLLTHEATSIKTVLVVCPLSTVLNWTNEYKTWLKDLDDDVNVYELTKFKKNMERKYQLQRWQRTGGVLIIGYNMFRNLTGTNKNIRKSMKEAILECLINPGPDLVVCDEGHLLKNEDTALSKCMRMVKTLRRIVLTGTPLQNNLIEYHCMVQFVKPNLLGTRKEFMNRFVNPITNGQFDDSTAYDVKLMKKRAHVLHKMLEGSIQRFDYSVLTPFLPPKQEYVIFVRLTDIQIKMYEYYLENFAKRQQGVGGSLFADFQALQRIWTHPIVLQLNAEKMEKINEKKFTSDSEGSLKDFIDDGSESSTESTSSSESNDDSDVQITDDKVSSSVTRSKANNNSDLEEPNALANEEAPPKETEWWLQFVESEHFEDIRISAKLLLLFGILKECEMIGDKVLVFSQSLYSLTLIERFLNMIDEKTQRNESLETLCHHTGSWSLGLDYFRLDGATSAENRSMWCRIFNRPTNTRARLFLISTRAGGLGINLTAANRVIIFDASWNPSHDVQSIFRVYRFGQKKPCYVYRFLAAGTMEEKIYNRQVTKLSLSCRVVDEQQIERHYSNHSLTELYTFERYKEKGTLNLPKDRLLAEIFLKYKDNVDNYHEHDSLLENKAEEELDEEERKQAWEEYEEEKKGKPLIPPSLMPNLLNCQNDLFMQQCSMMMNREFNVPQNINLQLDYENLQQLIRKDFPNATLEQQKMMTNRALMEMYNYWERQAVLQPMRSPVMPFKQSRVPVSPGVINSNASTFKQSRVPTSPGAINSNVPLLNHLLSPSTSGNYVNVRQPIQSIVPNPLSKPNIPNNNKKNTDDEIIEIMPSTSNTNVSNVQVAQPPAMNKNQEE